MKETSAPASPLPSPDQVRSDFNGIARLAGDDPGHNALYHSFLLGCVPPSCRDALDAGCGTGAFARALASRARRVTAIDLSPEMLRLARDRAAGIPNLDFVEADLQSLSLPHSSFDFIGSIATLHHLPADRALDRFARALRPGGVLAVLDIRSDAGLPERLLSVAAIAVSVGHRLRATGRFRERPEVRAAWAAHGAHESYLTFAQARALGERTLPGSVVRRHLLWRYSLVWTKPREPGSS